MRERKDSKSVMLVFKRDALLYDIENYAFVEGDVMQAQTEHERHQVFDIGQDGNVDRVTRILDLAHAECVEFLYPYTKLPCEELEERDDSFAETQEYHIRLLVPQDFSQSTVNLLTRLIHEYMVCRVLADWMSITNPASKAKWEDKIASINEQIRARMHARCGRVRRTQTPF